VSTLGLLGQDFPLTSRLPETNDAKRALIVSSTNYDSYQSSVPLSVGQLRGRQINPVWRSSKKSFGKKCRMIRTPADVYGRVFRILVGHEQLDTEAIHSDTLAKCEEVDSLIKKNKQKKLAGPPINIFKSVA